jgi:hypothetical protein
MRNYDPVTAAYLTDGRSVVSRVLFWVTAKDRVTGAPESIGFWNGDDDQVFVIGGSPRLYYGAGALLQVPPMIYSEGLSVRVNTLRLSPIAAPVAQAFRQYDGRFAPCELHRALFDPQTNALVAEPHRVFRGWVDEVRIKTPEKNGAADCSVTVASAARALTRSVPMMRSDATQQLRMGDRFRRYIAVSGAVETVWGERRAVAITPPAAGTGGGTAKPYVPGNGR